MLYPNIFESIDLGNKFIIDELNYDKEEMDKLHSSLLDKLTQE